MGIGQLLHLKDCNASACNDLVRGLGACLPAITLQDKQQAAALPQACMSLFGLPQKPVWMMHLHRRVRKALSPWYLHTRTEYGAQVRYCAQSASLDTSESCLSDHGLSEIGCP
jgi:hypothetical protein